MCPGLVGLSRLRSQAKPNRLAPPDQEVACEYAKKGLERLV